VCEKYLSLSKTCEPEDSGGDFRGGKVKIKTIANDLRLLENKSFRNLL